MIEKGDRLDDVTQEERDALLVGPCEHGQDYPANCSECFPGDLMRRLCRAIGLSAQYSRLYDEVRDEFQRLRDQLASRGPCAHCGADNPRGGLYCSDRCRARHARIHAPGGRVRSSRSLASGGWSLVIHLPPGEADRGSKFRVKDTVYVVEGDE